MEEEFIKSVKRIISRLNYAVGGNIVKQPIGYTFKLDSGVYGHIYTNNNRSIAVIDMWRGQDLDTVVHNKVTMDYGWEDEIFDIITQGYSTI